MEVDLDPSLDGNEGQGHRSKVKVKHQNYVFSLLSKIRSEVKVTKAKGQGHQDQDHYLKKRSHTLVPVKSLHDVLEWLV